MTAMPSSTTETRLRGSLTVRPAARPAFAALLDALEAAEERGRAVPCRGPSAHLWTSDDHHDRADAAEACRSGCPVLALCHRYAVDQGEAHHVFGGKDRTSQPGKRSAETTSSTDLDTSSATGRRTA